MYRLEKLGRGCISVKVVADSVCSETGTRITTFELEYPRFIHSELMTHRMFSRNAASSRAIPVEKMVEQALINPAHPIHWGANQAGMQANEELNQDAKDFVMEEWLKAAFSATQHAKRMNAYGAHKQIVNRILEPFQIMKTVVTATEWNNFWYLRTHKDAQPEIQELANVMKECYELSEPVVLKEGDWHTPYYKTGYWVPSSEDLLGDALAISSSCCAQVSFRSLDDSLDKAKRIYERLVSSKPVHASPFEHQATPFSVEGYDIEWDKPSLFNAPKGVTHESKDGWPWSGNFKNWCQYRQLINDNVVEG